MTGSTGSKAQTYRIQVSGWLDLRWSDWFDGLTMSHHLSRGNQPLTVLTGPIADQAALHGILASLRDLNLTLLSVNRIEPSPPSEGGEEETENE